MTRWFDPEKDGLRQIGERRLERRGFGIIGVELHQNVMDTGAIVQDSNVFAGPSDGTSQ